jgi:hypothetical protein
MAFDVEAIKATIDSTANPGGQMRITNILLAEILKVLQELSARTAPQKGERSQSSQ